MSLYRAKEYPTKQQFESTDDYVKRLRDAIQEESADRIQDFDILKLGNIGWEDVRAYGTSANADQDGLANAISAISTTETTLLISNQQDVTADATIPATMTLRFLRGGSLNISSSKTVTINGQVEAGEYEIFEGAGNVDFSGSTNSKVLAIWFEGDYLNEQVTKALYNTSLVPVHVVRENSGYTWMNLVELGEGQTLVFDYVYQTVTCTGDSGADGSGSSDIMLRIGRYGFLAGGRFTSSRSAWDTSNAWTGIRMGRATDEYGGYSRMYDVSIVGFERGLVGISSATHGNFYNDFHLKTIRDCYYGVYLEGTGKGINENNFHIQRISVGATFSDAGDGGEIGIYLYENGGAVSSNKFWHPCLENGGSSGTRTAIKLKGATYTQIFGPRTEDWYNDFVTEAGDSVTPVDNYVYGLNASPRVTLVNEESLRFYGAGFPCVLVASGDQRARSDGNYLAHYNKVSTAVTVTVGSGSNFTTLQEAVDYYSGSILEAHLTFQLSGNLTITDEVTITNFISAGGMLVIDTNANNITTSDSQAINIAKCQGLNVHIKGTGTISGSKDGEATFLIYAHKVGHLHVQDVNLAYTGNNTGYGVYFFDTDGKMEDVDTDNTNPIDYTYYAKGASVVAEDGANEAGGTGTRLFIEGAMGIDNTGDIYTEAGSVSPA